MFILELHQADRTHPVGLFETESDVLSWLESLPYIKKEIDIFDDIEFKYYFIQYDQLPEYDEVKWKDSVFPLTHYMFVPDNGDIEAIWYELPVMNSQHGLVHGMTQVDAYLVENTKVSSYIEAREAIKQLLFNHFKAANKDVSIGGIGSEDGEYVYVKDEELIHIDSSTVDAFLTRESDVAFIQQVTNHS